LQGGGRANGGEGEGEVRRYNSCYVRERERKISLHIATYYKRARMSDQKKRTTEQCFRCFGEGERLEGKNDQREERGLFLTSEGRHGPFITFFCRKEGRGSEKGDGPRTDLPLTRKGSHKNLLLLSREGGREWAKRFYEEEKTEIHPG